MQLLSKSDNSLFIVQICWTLSTVGNNVHKYKYGVLAGLPSVVQANT
jgi:hypothetical protein